MREVGRIQMWATVNLKSLTVATALCMLTLAALPVAAHHSFAAEYEAGKRVTVTGTVTRFDYRSPHSILLVEVSGADGAKQSWMLEFGSPLLLSRAGWSAATFKFGDAVQAFGVPARSGALRISVVEIRRPADGFSYKAEPGSQEAKPAPN